jgi:hypothetical protein
LKTRKPRSVPKKGRWISRNTPVSGNEYVFCLWNSFPKGIARTTTTLTYDDSLRQVGSWKESKTDGKRATRVRYRCGRSVQTNSKGIS